MDNRILNRSWRVWISAGMVDGAYVADNPNRPTENMAIRNLRDAAKLRYYKYKMREYGKILAQNGGRERYFVPRFQYLS